MVRHPRPSKDRQVKKPVISAIMPARNAARFLDDALASIRAQRFEDWDLHFFDHDSEDETASIFERHAKEDRRLIWREDISGATLGAIRDSLARGSGGEFIAITDADDVSHPDRFAATVDAFNDAPDLAAVATALQVVNGAGEIQYVSKAAETPTSDFDAFPIQGAWLPHPSLMIRREAYIRAGGYSGFFQSAEDFDLLMRLEEIGALRCVPETLCDYRIHEDSESSQKSDSMWRFNTLALLDAYSRRKFGIDMTWLVGRNVDDFFHIDEEERELFRANEFVQKSLFKQKRGAHPSDEDRRVHGQLKQFINSRNKALSTQLDAWFS